MSLIFTLVAEPDGSINLIEFHTTEIVPNLLVELFFGYSA